MARLRPPPLNEPATTRPLRPTMTTSSEGIEPVPPSGSRRATNTPTSVERAAVARGQTHLRRAKKPSAHVERSSSGSAPATASRRPSAIPKATRLVEVRARRSPSAGRRVNAASAQHAEHGIRSCAQAPRPSRFAQSARRRLERIASPRQARRSASQFIYICLPLSGLRALDWLHWRHTKTIGRVRPPSPRVGREPGGTGSVTAG